jgi:hypothetical protein
MKTHLRDQMKLGRVTAAIAIASTMLVGIVAPALGHDMSNMDGHDMSAAPNAMGSHMAMDAHMVMTPVRPETPADIERAHEILTTLRKVLSDYRDPQVAFDQGYRIFLPSVPQEVYHFTDYSAAAEEYRGHFSPARPGSLLYVKNARGEYVLVGAMYSAPPDATPEQLDNLIPLSVARWHAHTNICLPKGITLNDLLRGDIGAARSDMPGMMPIGASPEAPDLNRRLGFLADGRFGFTGKIADAPACEAAGGHFIPQAFGWMTHVYPFNDDLKVAFGTSVPKPPTN